MRYARRRFDEVPVYPLPWLLGVARSVSANVSRAALQQLRVRVEKVLASLTNLDRNDPRLAKLALHAKYGR